MGSSTFFSVSWSLCFLCPLHQTHRICSPSARCSPGEPARQQRGQRDVPARTCPTAHGAHGDLCAAQHSWGKTGSVKILVLPHTLCLQCWDVLPAVPKASSSNSLVLSSCLEWWGGNPGAGTARALSGGRSGSLMLQSGRKSRTRCVPAQYSV